MNRSLRRCCCFQTSHFIAFLCFAFLGDAQPFRTCMSHAYRRTTTVLLDVLGKAHDLLAGMKFITSCYTKDNCMAIYITQVTFPWVEYVHTRKGKKCTPVESITRLTLAAERGLQKSYWTASAPQLTVARYETGECQNSKCSYSSLWTSLSASSWQ